MLSKDRWISCNAEVCNQSSFLWKSPSCVPVTSAWKTEL